MVLTPKQQQWRRKVAYLAVIGAAVALVTLVVLSLVGCGLVPDQQQQSSIRTGNRSTVESRQSQERNTARAEGDARDVSSHSYQLGEGWRTLLMDWWRRGVVILAGFLLGVAWVAGRMRIGYLDMAAGVTIAGSFTLAALYFF